MRLVELNLRVNFYFSPILCFLFPFVSRAIRYYSSTRTTAAVQTSNSLESEECSLFAVRSMHTLCRLHGPFSAEVYKYSTRKYLHVHFLFFLCFFSLARVCCTIRRSIWEHNFPYSPLCVPSHMYYSQSRLIACVTISVSLLSNQLLVCFLHTSTAV